MPRMSDRVMTDPVITDRVMTDRVTTVDHLMADRVICGAWHKTTTETPLKLLCPECRMQYFYSAEAPLLFVRTDIYIHACTACTFCLHTLS